MRVGLGTFGARTRPFNTSLREHVLVLGLGQVGLVAVAMVQEMLRQALPPRELQAHTRLLAIAQRRSLAQEQLLPRESRLLLTQDHVRWSDVPGRYAMQGVARWWPRTPNNHELQENPAPSRPFGRLLIWNNTQLIGEKLYQVADWLQTSSQRDQQPRLILVLASLTEPEGSGMIFDVVGRLRDLVYHTPTTIAGVFSLDAAYQNENERLIATATAYASLKELDAVSVNPKSYPHELPYVGMSGSPVEPQRSFDHVCLTGDTATANPYPEETLADFASTWILSLVLENRPLPTAFARNTHQQRYEGYTMFGAARLSLPVRAALDLRAADIAKSALESLLLFHDNSPDSWVQKVIARAHSDLLTNGLIEHPLLIDKLRELRRRVLYSHISVQRPKTGLLQGGRGKRDILREAAMLEWSKLLRENEAEMLDTDGVTIRRDVLRSRIEDALTAGLRSMTSDLEQAVVTLAYHEGQGLQWTLLTFQELARQIENVLVKVREKVDPAYEDIEELRDNWFAAVGGRDTATIDKFGNDLVTGVTHWIGWQVRVLFWEALRGAVEGLRDLLRVTIEQIPREIEKLEVLRHSLQEELEYAFINGPAFPAGTFCTQDWIKEGTQHIPRIDTITHDALIHSVFTRWSPRDLPPARQVQRFPTEILEPARLTIQPQTRFVGIHDFALQNQVNPLVQQSLARLRSSAAPPWSIQPPTGKLDENYTPPQAVEIVRETPRNFSLAPHIESPRLTYINVPSPDPDEVLVIRMTYNWSIEYIKLLREDYRRAYYRISADNVPLHVDRRWEATIPDLIHTTLRAEVSSLWESILQSMHRNSTFALSGLQALSGMLAKALDADVNAIQHITTPLTDIHLFIFQLKPFRLKVPPPQCTFVFLMAQRGNNEISDDLFNIVSNHVPAENFFFVVNITGRNDIESILQPLRLQSFMPLALSEGDIKHVVSAPRPASALRDIVITRINLTAVSPFYTRAPVPDHMFFGRDGEIADVRSKLNTHSVVLIGGRRIGKTSTLQKIKRILDGTPNSTMIPYYLDCSNVLQHRHFFRRIQRDWQVNISEDADPIEFDEVVDYLTNQQRGRKPVFLLDEVDRLLKTDQAATYDEPLFRTFRSLSNEKRCQFLFSGEKILLRSIRNAKSVMFNFPKEVHLGPLQRDKVRLLVTEPFEMLNIWLEQADDLIQQIYEISAGHPNIVQTICHALVRIIDRDKQANLIRREHLGQALDDNQVQMDIVDTIWGQMHPLAKLVTLLWQETTRHMSLEDIIHMLQAAGLQRVLTQDIKEKVIPDLQLYNFVRMEGQNYVLIPIHFPTIIDEMTDKRMEIQAILEKVDDLQDTRTYY